MRIINDSCTTEFVDRSGDKLILLQAPRRRDVVESERLERKEALEQLDIMKSQGVEIDAVIEDAQKSPEALQAAQEAAARHEWGPEVMRFRLTALAVSLVVDGERIGGAAILEAYDRMDPPSAQWIDDCVSSVWSPPSEAEKNGEGADDEVSDGAGVSTPEASAQ